MNQHDILLGIVERAAEGQPLEPISLRFSLLQCETSAFRLASRSLRDEFSFLRNVQDEVSDSELEQFDGLFSWLVEQLALFNCDIGRSKEHLTKLLAVAEALDCDDLLWDAIYKTAPILPERLLATLASIIKECCVDGEKALKRAGYTDAHIQGILSDIKSKDWKSVEWFINHQRVDYQSPIKIQAAAALYRYDSSYLKSILDAEDSFFEIVTYVLHTPVERSLRFSLESKNWTLKFWALYHSIRCVEHEMKIYCSEWQALLSEASSHSVEWKRWLDVLNQYPSRYPHLQEVLGNVLVQAPNEALDIYINSISMTTSDTEKEPVAVALATFRQRSALSQRQRVWQAAFKRWEQWDFGCTNEPKILTKIASTPLDFPVVGYFTECLDSGGRDALIDGLKIQAGVVERTWYSSVLAPVTERFKLLSTYQLLAKAEAVSTDDSNWLPGAVIFQPPWEDGSLYRSFRYDQEFGRPTYSEVTGTAQPLTLSDNDPNCI